MSPAPPPIDPRGPRFNQAVLATALLLGFAADARWVVPLFAGVLFLGAAFGPRYGPFLRFYAEVVRPRLRPPAELEDPRPPRFAAAVGVVFLAAATASFAAGAVGLGWALALVVAALAGLAATTGICVGCEVYLWLVLGRRKATGEAVRVPAHIVDGAERTWVVFTTPYCASCGPVTERLRTSDPEARIVTVDATEDPDLADAFAVRRAPTVLLADAEGEVQARLVGPAAVASYVKVGSSTSAR
jgi:hypothetical protein